MSNKHKHHHGSDPVDTSELKLRIERTCKEGRLQQALELVNQLYRAEPTPENKELLKNTYLKRGEQLVGQGCHRDAAAVFEVAAQLDAQNPEWLARIVDAMCKTGDVAKTQQILARLQALGGTIDKGPILTKIADSAIVADNNSRDQLPTELRADYDRILQAFEQVEAGEDDAARQTLEGIGIRSPFAEGKLLLRGLQAFYRGDDARARENWQRLDPNRPPARLAAPFRATIDPAYHQAQSFQTQQILSRQYEWLQGDVMATHVRALQKGFANGETLSEVFRAAEALLPTLRQRSPQLVDRLARMIYASILRYGPDEIPRYRRVFGNPPDDPNFNRLEAIAFTRGGNFAEAHERWKRVLKEIEANPERWPGEQGTLARALIWNQMGDNAALIPTKEQQNKLPRFLRDLEGLPKPLSPSASECYTRSIELAPNLLEAHEGLVRTYHRNLKPKQAIQAAQRLLEVFPDHDATLRKLTFLYRDEEKYTEARQTCERALRHNPFDRGLRQALGDAWLREAREWMMRGNFDEARKGFQTALEFLEKSRYPSVWCRWAACEIKADNQTKADELLDLARAAVPGELLLTYHLLIETNRVGLSNKLKTRLTREFNKNIEETPTPALAVALVTLAADYAGLEYYGRQTHFKKIIAYAGQVPKQDYTESQWIELLQGLSALGAGLRAMSLYFDFVARMYPANPRFPYLHALYLMGDSPDESVPHWRIVRLLDDVERLAAKLPEHEPGLREMLEDVKRRRAMMEAFNPFMRRFSSLFGGMVDDLFGDDEDEEDF